MELMAGRAGPAGLAKRVKEADEADPAISSLRLYDQVLIRGANQNLIVFGASVKLENVATASVKYSTSVLSSSAEYMAFSWG